MPEVVKQFIDRQWPEVESHITRWRSRQASGVETLSFVYALYAEWERIPLEEKLIPYVPMESTFWASVNMLRLSAANSVPGAVENESGKPTEVFQRDFDDKLDEVYVHMRDRLPIPEDAFDGVWRRHLP